MEHSGLLNIKKSQIAKKEPTTSERISAKLVFQPPCSLPSTEIGPVYEIIQRHLYEIILVKFTSHSMATLKTFGILSVAKYVLSFKNIRHVTAMLLGNDVWHLAWWFFPHSNDWVYIQHQFK